MAAPGDPAANRYIGHLLEELDQLPEPQRVFDRPFLLPIKGVFTIEGRGTVVTGKVEQGQVVPGDKLEILGLGGRRDTVVTRIEAFGEVQVRAAAGENVGLLLRGGKHSEVARRQGVSVPKCCGHMRIQVFLRPAMARTFSPAFRLTSDRPGRSIACGPPEGPYLVFVV